MHCGSELELELWWTEKRSGIRKPRYCSSPNIFKVDRQTNCIFRGCAISLGRPWKTCRRSVEIRVASPDEVQVARRTSYLATSSNSGTLSDWRTASAGCLDWSSLVRIFNCHLGHADLRALDRGEYVLLAKSVFRAKRGYDGEEDKHWTARISTSNE